jgi:hypothetical protein
MFPWSPDEFKTGSVILEARTVQITLQNLNPTRSTKNIICSLKWYSTSARFDRVYDSLRAHYNTTYSRSKPRAELAWC